MLRIDLLPAYVAQRRLTRQLSVLFTGILALIIVVGLGYAVPLKSQVTQYEAQAQTAEAFQTKAGDIKAETQTIQAMEPPYDAKLKFVDDVRAYNLAYPNLYRKLAKYTVPSILYNSMAVSGGTSLSISAYTPSLAQLSNYLAHIWNDPDLKSVTVSAFPGYRAEYSPSKKTFTLPQLPPGYFAHFKNSAQQVKSYTVEGGVVTKIGSGNETGGMQGGMQGDMAGGMQQNAPKPRFDAAHSGFDFTVSAVLNQAITPVPDPGTSAATTGGAPGGAPPGPGGAPGGPPRPPAANPG